MTQKLYLNSSGLVNDAVSLALAIIDADDIPDLLIGIWRGGTPVAIAIHETLCACGYTVQHTVIKAASYKGIDSQGTVVLSDPERLISEYPQANNILLIDDVFDTGHTLQTMTDKLQQCSRGQDRRIRVATPWYKPARRAVALKPDYWLHETDKWLVFPHELCGLDPAEILANKTEISEANRQNLLQHLSK